MRFRTPAQVVFGFGWNGLVLDFLRPKISEIWDPIIPFFRLGHIFMDFLLSPATAADSNHVEGCCWALHPAHHDLPPFDFLAQKLESVL